MENLIAYVETKPETDLLKRVKKFLKDQEFIRDHLRNGGGFEELEKWDLSLEKLIYQTFQKAKPYEWEFTTVAGVVYACYFVSADAVFNDYKDVAKIIYAFNLNIERGGNTKQLHDEKTGRTVVAIIRKFLLDNQFAVVYLCDTSDGRQTLRKRKFDTWFNRSRDIGIIKIDREISAADPIILNSLIISETHPLLNEIIAAFEDFNNRMNNK